MKRTKNRKLIIVRTVLAAVSAMAMLIAGMGNAFGDQARASSAHSYGLEATGLLPIARTPTASAASPPDDSIERNAVLRVPAAALAVDANVVAKAEAHRDDSAVPVLVPGRPQGASQDAITIERVNSRGYSSATTVRVLVRALPTTDCNLDPELCIAAVEADLIEAEAVARCVNNQPVFDTGYNLLNLRVLESIDLATLVEPLLDTVLDLLGTEGPVGSLNLVNVNRGVKTTLADNGQGAGEAITALEVKVLGDTEVIRIAHAEARMPRDCGVTTPPPSPTPGARLAQTGGGGMSSLLGGSLLAGAVLMTIFVRKYRFSQ